MNHFLAKFKYWIESDWVSFTTSTGIIIGVGTFLWWHLLDDGSVYFGKKNESECTIYADPYTTMDQSVRRKMLEKNGSEYEEENERKIMDQST